MSDGLIRIHNLEINEITDRAPTIEELAQREADQAKAVAQTVADAETAAAKAALLDKLGITEKEARLLLS